MSGNPESGEGLHPLFLLKGGGALKARFRVSQGVTILFMNPKGRSATFTYTR